MTQRRWRKDDDERTMKWGRRRKDYDPRTMTRGRWHEADDESASCSPGTASIQMTINIPTMIIFTVRLSVCSSVCLSLLLRLSCSVSLSLSLLLCYWLCLSFSVCLSLVVYAVMYAALILSVPSLCSLQFPSIYSDLPFTSMEVMTYWCHVLHCLQ